MELHEAFAVLTVCAHPARYEVMAFLGDTGGALFEEIKGYLTEFSSYLSTQRMTIEELSFILSELERYKTISEEESDVGTVYRLTNRGHSMLDILSDLDERRELL